MPGGADATDRVRLDAVLSGRSRAMRAWSSLRAEYAWRPPFSGAAPTKPHRIEVVFSAHDDVVLDQQDRAYDVRVAPGGMFVVGEVPTTLLQVGAYSDTLEMYPDLALLRSVAAERGVDRFALEPTLADDPVVRFARDAVVLGIAQLLRRACMDQRTISDVEGDTLARLLADRLVTLQHPAAAPALAPARLGRRRISRVADYIEAELTGRLCLDDLARVAGLSPFHFARCFKATTGVAPHQYVLGRRLDLAKRLIVTTRQPVEEIACSIGFENISHFRRQFAAQVGVGPGALRRATQTRAGHP